MMYEEYRKRIVEIAEMADSWVGKSLVGMSTDRLSEYLEAVDQCPPDQWPEIPDCENLIDAIRFDILETLAYRYLRLTSDLGTANKQLNDMQMAEIENG